MNTNSPQQRKAAWMQRRDERIARAKKEADDRAAEIANSTKHFLPSELRSLTLEKVVAMARAFNDVTNRNADKALIQKEIIRRAKKRNIDLKNVPDPYSAALAALNHEVDERLRSQTAAACAELQVQNRKLIQNLIGTISTFVTLMTKNAPDVGIKIPEAEWLKYANEFYNFMFEKTPSYFKVRAWSLDSVKKFVEFMKHEFTELTKEDDMMTEGVTSVTSSPNFYSNKLDLMSQGARKAIFGI